jgi:hypothetical protein
MNENKQMKVNVVQKREGCGEVGDEVDNVDGVRRLASNNHVGRTCLVSAFHSVFIL